MIRFFSYLLIGFAAATFISSFNYEEYKAWDEGISFGWLKDKCAQQWAMVRVIARTEDSNNVRWAHFMRESFRRRITTCAALGELVAEMMENQASICTCAPVGTEVF